MNHVLYNIPGNPLQFIIFPKAIRKLVKINIDTFKRGPKDATGNN